MEDDPDLEIYRDHNGYLCKKDELELIVFFHKSTVNWPDPSPIADAIYRRVALCLMKNGDPISFFDDIPEVLEVQVSGY